MRPAVFSAVRDEKVIGAITCHFVDESFAMIGRLAVDPSYRGQGTGNLLVKQAELFMGSVWMHGQPGKIGLLDETKKRNPASQFYEHMGYAPGDQMAGQPDEPFLVKDINLTLQPT